MTPVVEHQQTERDELPSFEALYRAESRHFWFRSRNAVIADVVGRVVRDLAPGYRVLEVGCGAGNVLRVLERVCAGGHVTGSELHEEGLAFARRRVRCPLIQLDIYRMPFEDHFDVIGMFDVLEHLEDDAQALQLLRRALKTDGRLLLTVPAYKALWSHTDVTAGHFRRYAPAGLGALLRQQGFEVEYCTPFMAPLAPLMWLGRKLAAWRNGQRRGAALSDRELALKELAVSPWLNWTLQGLLALERPWIARRRVLPFGTSLLAFARRSEGRSATSAAA